MRIVLVNPPGSVPYLRDNYCAKVSRTGYVNPPVDLIVVSGGLSAGNELRAVDAIACRLPAHRALAAALAREPEAAVVLTSRLSWPEDAVFVRSLRDARPGIVIAGCGDVFLPGAGEPDWRPLFDVAVYDYTSPHVAAALGAAGTGARTAYAGVGYRTGTGGWTGGWSPASGEYRLPVPRHELFPLRRYRHPFLRRIPYTVVVGDLGCPHRCGYCLSGGLGYKRRPVGDVVCELRHVGSLGVREIFFGDQCFGADRARAGQLLAAMAELRPGLEWGCYMRVDAADGPLVGAMRRAGCRTIVFGIEGAAPVRCGGDGKLVDAGRARAVFAACRRLGITTVGTFMLGLPGETAAERERTIDLALDVAPDFASFNAAVARPLTELGRAAGRPGAARDGDPSGTGLRAEHAELASALRRAQRRFYLRPGYLMRRLLAVRGPMQALILAQNGWGLARRLGRP